MTLLSRTLVVLLLLAFASPASFAEDGAPARGGEIDWELRLSDLQRDLQLAQQRVVDATDAYRNWRQKKHPRGAKKADLLAEIEAAELELADLEAAWPEELEKARRAGLSPGALRRFETPPAAASDD